MAELGVSGGVKIILDDFYEIQVNSERSSDHKELCTYSVIGSKRLE